MNAECRREHERYCDKVTKNLGLTQSREEIDKNPVKRIIFKCFAFLSALAPRAKRARGKSF
jgi:hypothetical protein